MSISFTSNAIAFRILILTLITKYVNISHSVITIFVYISHNTSFIFVNKGQAVALILHIKLLILPCFF